MAPVGLLEAKERGTRNVVVTDARQPDSATAVAGYKLRGNLTLRCSPSCGRRAVHKSRRSVIRDVVDARHQAPERLRVVDEIIDAPLIQRGCLSSDDITWAYRRLDSTAGSLQRLEAAYPTLTGLNTLLPIQNVAGLAEPSGESSASSVKTEPLCRDGAAAQPGLQSGVMALATGITGLLSAGSRLRDAVTSWLWSKTSS